jgi:hypothetical protein
MPILNVIIVVGAVGLTTVNGRATMKTYRPWAPEQAYLLPPSPSDWLPEGHLVYFLLDIVRELDLGPILRAVDAKDARGEKPYSPIMMATLLLYAYCAVVEPVFGQIKEARGFRRFLLRGLRKVAGEWSMLTATHNLLKLFRQTTEVATG